MRLSQLTTVDILRPGIGKRYTMLPVDHIDITGFHANYEGSPLRPALLDLVEGDRVTWEQDGERFEAYIDEVVIDSAILRVAFRDAGASSQPAEY